MRLHHGAAAGEHRPVLLVDDLDAQAVGASYRNRICDFSAAPASGWRRSSPRPFLHGLQPRHLGAHLLGFSACRLTVRFFASTSPLHRPPEREDPAPPPFTTCDESPEPLPPNIAHLQRRVGEVVGDALLVALGGGSRAATSAGRRPSSPSRSRRRRSSRAAMGRMPALLDLLDDDGLQASWSPAITSSFTWPSRLG